MNDLTGQSLGRFHIIEQLGQGGMAVVYKAFDTRLEREVAVKIIRSELFGSAIIERILNRFEREAKAMARLSHPNIVKVLDFGEHEGSPFLVMELLSGGTLKDLLDSPMPYAQAVSLLEPIARGLAYAHSQHILHRDVKPSNILITHEGVPVLTDFGIAKILDVEEGHTLTGTGIGIGTPEYMAPEQGLGQNADERADVYSLGIVIYELTTGHKPYTADTPLAVLLKQVNDPLPSPSVFIHGLPEPVERVIYKALAKNPQDRYRSMDEFAGALTKVKNVELAKNSIHQNTQKTIIEHRSESTVTTDQVNARVVENISGNLNYQNNVSKPPVKTTKFQIWKLTGFTLLGIGLVGVLIGTTNGWFNPMDSLKFASTPIITSSSVPTSKTIITQLHPTLTEALISPSAVMQKTVYPEGIAKQNINCRSGPGTIYPILKTIPQNANLQIKGQNQESSWYFIGSSGLTENCWVSNTNILTESDFERVGLPVLTALPTPYPIDAQNPTQPESTLSVVPTVMNVNGGDPYAEIYKLTKTGECSWTVAFRVYNLTPNSYVYLRAKDYEMDCDSKKWNTKYWGYDAYKADSNGTLAYGETYVGGTFIGGWGVGYGEHSWTFTDLGTNKNIPLKFSTQ